jgi:hypothetical protein
MRPIALTPNQQRRIEKLARDSGRTPAQALRFVLRDGFEFCEWELRESRAADESVKLSSAVPNDEAQRRARAVVASRHGRRREAA